MKIKTKDHTQLIGAPVRASMPASVKIPDGFDGAVNRAIIGAFHNAQARARDDDPAPMCQVYSASLVIQCTWCARDCYELHVLELLF